MVELQSARVVLPEGTFSSFSVVLPEGTSHLFLEDIAQIQGKVLVCK